MRKTKQQKYTLATTIHTCCSPPHALSNIYICDVKFKTTLLFGLTDPDDKKSAMTGHFGQKLGLAKSRFLF